MIWLEQSFTCTSRFDLDQGPKEGDAVFAYNEAQLVVDSVSLEFVRGATIDYAAELIKSNFEVGLVQCSSDSSYMLSPMLQMALKES